MGCVCTAAAGGGRWGAGTAAAVPPCAAQVLGGKGDTDDPRSLATLLSVPLLWASYAVVARAVLTSDALPLPLEVVNLGAYAVATCGLLGLLAAGLVGLSTTPAARASFLVQTTTVLVPLFEATALRRRLPARLWASVGVSAVAITLFTGLPSLPLAPGDAASMGAAVAYSAHVLRLSALAGRLPSALPLAAAKSGVQATYAAAYALAVGGGVAGLAATLGDAAAAVTAAPATVTATATATAAASTAAAAAAANSGGGGSGASAPAVLAGVVWMGLAGTAAATWAQVAGQRGVRPAAAGVIYAGQPAAAAAAAAVVLGEALSPTQVAAVALTLVGAGSLWDVPNGGGGGRGEEPPTVDG
ncbi:hypothetical protein I4F81_000588 [Pyropia yezoensis]|uniref:Uncharacterized protein n=1 Tax=Pyropia yezoensis TaxID=2788 RepID=A0ACC3BJ27_PYRYE|nr:hypothetical protein I4F81_000588 [Neopyropia yezoensis]